MRGEVGRGSGGSGQADAGAVSPVSTPDVSGPSRGGGSTSDRGTTPVRAIDIMRGQGSTDTRRGINPAFREVPTGTVPRAEFKRGDEASTTSASQAPQSDSSGRRDGNPQGGTVLRGSPTDKAQDRETGRAVPYLEPGSGSRVARRTPTKATQQELPYKPLTGNETLDKALATGAAIVDTVTGRDIHDDSVDGKDAKTTQNDKANDTKDTKADAATTSETDGTKTTDTANTDTKAVDANSKTDDEIKTDAAAEKINLADSATSTLSDSPLSKPKEADHDTGRFEGEQPGEISGGEAETMDVTTQPLVQEAPSGEDGGAQLSEEPIEESDWLGEEKVELVDIGEPLSPQPTQAEITDWANRAKEALQDTWASDPSRRFWPDTPLSYLQCARSITQLKQGLENVTVPILHHHGSLEFPEMSDRETVTPHQWLQIGNVTTDITGDQHGPIEAPNGVVAHTEQELRTMGLAYKPRYVWELHHVDGVWHETVRRDLEPQRTVFRRGAVSSEPSQEAASD